MCVCRREGQHTCFENITAPRGKHPNVLAAISCDGWKVRRPSPSCTPLTLRRQTKLTIERVEVIFPFKPYSMQIQMISNLLKALKHVCFYLFKSMASHYSSPKMHCLRVLLELERRCRCFVLPWHGRMRKDVILSLTSSGHQRIAANSKHDQEQQ